LRSQVDRVVFDSPIVSEFQMAGNVESSLNPIGWVQFRLNGGIRRLIPLMGIYAGAMLFFNVIFFRASEERVTITSFANGSLSVTIVISAILLILVASGAINKAILRDFTSDMITSHRTSAMSGRMAVLGYLTGPTSSILGLTLVNWFACSVLAQIGGYPWFGPSFVFVALLCFALVMWSGSVLAGLSYRGKLSFAAMLMPLSFVAFIPPLARMLQAHPGFALLLNYGVIFDLTSSAANGVTSDAMKSVIISMLFQVMLTLTFFIASSRRYLRDDVTAFTPALAFALVALCTLACAVGLDLDKSQTQTQTQLITARQMGLFVVEKPVQVFSTVISLALLAVLPVANAAWSGATWSRRKKKDAAFAMPKPRGTWETAIAATIVVFGILTLVSQPSLAMALDNGVTPIKESMGYLVASLLLMLITFGGVLRFCYAYMQNAVWIMGIFLILTWALPLVGDLMMEYANERPPDAPKSLLFSSSPLGIWILQFRNMKGPIVGGLVVQAVMAVAAQILARRAKY
jgi:hypothetical protein